MTTQTFEAKQTNWTGDVEIRKIFYPTGKFKANGEPQLRMSKLTTIVLTNGPDHLKFNVTNRGGFSSITDDRERRTGVMGTSGLWNTREVGKPSGPKKSLTPSGWIQAVRNMICEQDARYLLRLAGVWC